MIRRCFRACAALAALTLTGLPVQADRIRLSDGSRIDDVSVESDGLLQVTFKEKSRTREVASEKVLSIAFEKKPKSVDEADASLEDGDLEAAETRFDNFVGAFIDNPEKNGDKRYPWAPAYAAWRVVEIRSALGDLNGVADAADRVIKSFPESRYVPLAYMAKANALTWQDKAKNAQTVLEAFRKLIADRGLSKRWQLECDLALIATDPALAEPARRDRLVVVQDLAGTDFPSVRNRARVAEGESHLKEVESEQDVKKRLVSVGLARGVFEKILAEFGKAEDETLAGAFLGLGDCLYQEAVGKGRDLALLDQAMESYMRVVVSYAQLARYQPKALFFAGRCYEVMGDVSNGDGGESMARAKRLYVRVVRDFPSSRWAEQAKAALR